MAWSKSMSERRGYWEMERMQDIGKRGRRPLRELGERGVTLVRVTYAYILMVKYPA